MKYPEQLNELKKINHKIKKIIIRQDFEKDLENKEN